MVRQKDEQRSPAPAKNRKRRKDSPAALVLLGERMREVRLARGFTSQEKFAFGSGIDRAYYGAVERGERDIGVLKLIEIASALGVEVGELIPPIQTLKAATPKKASKS